MVQRVITCQSLSQGKFLFQVPGESTDSRHLSCSILWRFQQSLHLCCTLLCFEKYNHYNHVFRTVRRVSDDVNSSCRRANPKLFLPCVGCIPESVSDHAGHSSLHDHCTGYSSAPVFLNQVLFTNFFLLEQQSLNVDTEQAAARLEYRHCRSLFCIRRSFCLVLTLSRRNVAFPHQHLRLHVCVSAMQQVNAERLLTARLVAVSRCPTSRPTSASSGTSWPRCSSTFATSSSSFSKSTSSSTHCRWRSDCGVLTCIACSWQ